MKRILVILAICAAVVAVAVWLWLLYLAQPLAAPISSTAPQSNQPASANQYENFSGKPAALRIPTLEIDAPVVSVGLTSSGAMDAPNNLIEVGWYDKSARLGEDSKYSVLMDGHYGTSWNQGVFYNLYKIKVDDQIVMATESGEEAVFKVVEIERKALEEVDMNKALYVYPDARQSLTLITCEGDYDAARQTYNDRVVVYAVRVQ